MSSRDSNARDDSVRALYTCAACGAGFVVEYFGVHDANDAKALSSKVQRYADGCPNCGSLDTKLDVLAG